MSQNRELRRRSTPFRLFSMCLCVYLPYNHPRLRQNNNNNNHHHSWLLKCFYDHRLIKIVAATFLPQFQKKSISAFILFICTTSFIRSRHLLFSSQILNCTDSNSSTCIHTIILSPPVLFVIKMQQNRAQRMKSMFSRGFQIKKDQISIPIFKRILLIMLFS